MLHWARLVSEFRTLKGRAPSLHPHPRGCAPDGRHTTVCCTHGGEGVPSETSLGEGLWAKVSRFSRWFWCHAAPGAPHNLSPKTHIAFPHLCQQLHQMEGPVWGRVAQGLGLEEEQHAVERERVHLDVHIQRLGVPGAHSLCKPAQQRRHTCTRRHDTMSCRCVRVAGEGAVTDVRPDMGHPPCRWQRDAAASTALMEESSRWRVLPREARWIC